LKAVQLVAPQQLEIVDVEPPGVAGGPPERVLVRAEKVSLCGSDLPFFAGTCPASKFPQPPGFPGHECVGVVVESTSPHFRPGDSVLALPHGSKGLAEYFVATANATVRLPSGPPLEALLMAQPLGTVVWAARKLGSLIHRDTVILGQGPLGLLFTHTFSNLGARTVIAMDRLEYRLEVARRMQATHTVNVARVNPIEAVREITDGRLADVAVEAVGHNQDTINQCLDLVRHQGTILAFGVPDEALYQLRFSDLFRRNLTLIPAVGPECPTDFALAVDWIAQGRLDVTPLLTHQLPFREAQRAFEMALERRDGVVKVVLDMTGK